MDFTFEDASYSRGPNEHSIWSGDCSLDCSYTAHSHLSHPHPVLGHHHDLDTFGSHLSLFDNFLSDAEQVLYPAPSVPAYDACSVAQSIPLFPTADSSLPSPAALDIINVAVDPISHRHSAHVHPESTSPLPYATPRPRHVTSIVALRTMATEDVLTNPEVPIPATQPDDVAAVAASVRKLQEAIRIPRMKVRVASSRTSARRTRPMPAPYSRPSPSSSSSSPSSPASSPASSNSNTPLTESPLPLTCPLPDCPSPSKTYSRRADLERHILTAGTHLLPSDAWACCGLPLAIARARRLPQSVLDQPPREYYGVRMVGGCGRENSRKDALGRHLNRREGRCWGEREGEWLVGNRFKEVWKAQMEAVVERDVQMLEAVDSGSGKARRSARGARR